MTKSFNRIIPSVCCFIFVLCLTSLVPAQESNATSNKTLLDIEIMMSDLGSDPVLAQRWGKLFRDLGESVRIRSPLRGDKVEIRESRRGTFRIVQLIGHLNPDGKVEFPQKTFSLDDSLELKEWLNELRLYGAQGSPEGQPQWGLTATQLESLLQLLSTPVTEDVNGLSFAAALEKLPLDKSLPLKFTESAEQRHVERKNEIVVDEVSNLSVGTSLAFLLSQEGLGFRPLRQPDESLRLEVRLLEELSDPWPIGRDVDSIKPRNLLLPKLFEQVTTGFEKARVSDVLKAVEDNTGVRILLDSEGCRQRKIDLETVRLNYPRRKTAWALIVHSVATGARVDMRYRMDEAGTVFLLFTPFVPRRVE